MTNYEELKPCPFCGAPVDEVDRNSNYPRDRCDYYAVYCEHYNKCPLDGEPCGSFDTKWEAIAAWNKRQGETE